jgi:hypothetical protein
MRTALSALLLPFAAWLGALQTLATNTGGVDDIVRSAVQVFHGSRIRGLRRRTPRGRLAYHP